MTGVQNSILIQNVLAENMRSYSDDRTGSGMGCMLYTDDGGMYFIAHVSARRSDEDMAQ